MGNYIACGCSSISSCRSSIVKVIVSTNGEEIEIDGPIKTAELMLENPQHFVVELKSVQIGKRFSPLPADEPLEMGGVYVMFHMSRARSVVKPDDLARLFIKVTGEMRKSCGGICATRVLPESVERSPLEEKGLPGFSFEGVGDESLARMTTRRLSICRSRKPSLETICEETSLSLQ